MEQTLIEIERGPAVEDNRNAFQIAMQDRSSPRWSACPAAGDPLRRRRTTWADLEVELFFFDDPPPAGSARRLALRAWHDAVGGSAAPSSDFGIGVVAVFGGGVVPGVGMIGESRRYEASVDPMMAAEATAWQAKRDQWQHARRAQERRLFGRLAVDRSPATRAAIVEQFLPLARQLARRYRNLEDLEDLEQIAAMGLVKAIDRFDPQRGLAFSSFAFPTILGELKRHLRDRGWSVRPPRSVQELAARVEPAANAIHAERGRSPTVPELAERVGSTVEQVLEAMQLATARQGDLARRTPLGCRQTRRSRPGGRV